MRVTFEVEDEEALRVLRRVLAALDVKEVQEPPRVDPAPAPAPLRGPTSDADHLILLDVPGHGTIAIAQGCSTVELLAALANVDPNNGPIYKSTLASRAAGKPPIPLLHPGIKPLLDSPGVEEWWCYLDNGERVAQVPNPAYWPEIALAVLSLVGAPPEPWTLRMMPRKREEEYAMEEGMQTRMLLPKDAAWKEVEVYLEAFIAERNNARDAARYREAVGAPVPPAFFHPVPIGTVQWRLLGTSGETLGVVPAQATRKDVLSALYDHLRAEPLEFGAECVLADPQDYSCDSRAFRLSARDLHPAAFAATSSPWLHIAAEPWVPPGRVPAYSTREEVARHVRAVASPEWFEEVRLHGVTLDVQPLDVDLIPVGDPFTVSLFSQDFS